MKSMILTSAAVFLIASAVITPARAETQELNGNDLLLICEDKREALKQWCRGYILGVADIVMDDYFTAPMSCPTMPIPQQQLVDIVIKNLKADPEYRHGSAKYLVAGAFIKAFPCRNNDGAKQ